jgi:hypothetical protein
MARSPRLKAAGKIGLALIILNEIRGLIVVALIVSGWIANGAPF